MKMTFDGKNAKLSTKLITAFLVFAMLFSVTALCAFAAGAEEDFIESVSRLESLLGMEWALAVEDSILKWEAYENAGGSPNANSAVAETYETYIYEKTLYDACNTFLDNSFEIGSPGFEYMSYTEQAALMDESQEIFATYKDVNKFASFDGIATAVTDFSMVYRTFSEQRGYCEAFVTNAALAAAAKNYADAKKYMDLAANAKKKIELVGYPGYEEAEDHLEDAKMFITATMNTAVPFIQSVQDIEYAENTFLAIVSALAAYKNVDSTADGVADAYRSLIQYAEAYNERIALANQTAKNVSSSIVGLIP